MLQNKDSADLGVRFNFLRRTIQETECCQCPNTFLMYISKYILYSRDCVFV